MIYDVGHRSHEQWKLARYKSYGDSQSLRLGRICQTAGRPMEDFCRTNYHPKESVQTVNRKLSDDAKIAIGHNKSRGPINVQCIMISNHMHFVLIDCLFFSLNRDCRLCLCNIMYAF